MSKHPRVLDFLDLEATRHDTESEDEDVDEDFDDFFDDITDAESVIQSSVQNPPHAPDAFEEWTNELLQRHARTKDDSLNSPRCSPEASQPNEDIPEINTGHAMQRIQCFRRWEDRICNRIRAWLFSTSPDVVFTLASTPGWVYWSRSPASALRYGLDPFEVTGIVKENGKLVILEVPQEEIRKIVSCLRDAGPHLSKGCWVRVIRGRFRGSVGVVTVASNVCASVLLVPFSNWAAPALSSLVRKRTRQPWAHPRLFDPVEAEAREKRGPYQLYEDFQEGENDWQFSEVIVIDRDEEKYKYRGVAYWHGLAVALVPSDYLSSDVGAIDVASATIFKESKHPLVNIDTMPRPIDWLFYPGEHVKCLSSGMEATVDSVDVRSLAVTTTENKVINVFWQDIVKVFYLGDYVRILAGSSVGKEYLGEYTRDVAGSSVGREGWVHHVHNEDVHVLRIVKGTDTIQVVAHIEHYICHVNSLTLTTNTEMPDRRQPTEDIWKRAMASGSAPWLNVAATITQQGHPLRNYPAVVKDVLIHQDTASGLKLILEITTYNAAMPRRLQTIDYDLVVDPETQWLLQFRHPLRANQSAYFPQSEYTFDKLSRPIPPAKNIPVLDCPKTPVPDITEAATPAWDPRIHEYEADIPWVLNRAFVGYPLRLSHPNSKKPIVGIPAVVGQNIVLNTIYRNKLKETEAIGLNPRHPGPRWAGPLMIIAGSDVGKYVHPVRQRTLDSVVQWTVRVCDRSETGVDSMLEEELVIWTSWLCEVHEDDERRKRNDAQARQLKEPAAGHGF